MDELKAQESETAKILKKVEDDEWIRPSQQEIFIAESHPPPSTQYTRVIQGTTNFRVKEYKEGDMVWMWDANKGKPTNIKENNHCWLALLRSGESQLMIPITYLHWRDKGTRCLSVDASSNPTRMG